MSKTHLHFPPILHLSLLFILHTVIAQSQDTAPMLELKKALTFPNSSWWTDPNPCNWEHVRCTNNRVTRVQIGGYNVQGILPDAVIGKLSELTTFEVMRNQLTGPLPSFSGLSNLQSLLLNENQFSSIPDDFFRGLTSLISLSLDKNQFGQWKIPESLKDASALQNFSANSANITGSIPRFFGASGGLASLTNLHLAHNNLEGGLPDEFAGSSIQSLWLNGQLSETKLTGSITVLGKMTSLVDVWLHQNMFSGPIPDVSGLKNLRVLSLRDNQLTGPVPESLVNLVSLKSVNLTNNLLQGKKPKFADGVLIDNDPLNRYCLDIPGVECDWRVNVFLDIAKPLGYPVVFAQNWDGNDPCDWSGVNCDGAKKNVTLINFQNKGLKGPIAPDYSKFTTLEKLYLNNNSFTGTIPNALVNITNLKILDVSFNDLSGQVPKFNESVLVKAVGTKIVIGDAGNSPVSAPGGKSDKVAASRSWKHKIIGIVVGSVGGFLIICLALFFVVMRRKRINKVQSPNTNTMVIHPRLSGSDRDIKITIAGVRGGGSEGASHTISGPSASAGDVHVVESGNMVISIQVLRNVTNNFSEENILGRGGFGTVYKGELHDGTKIAVKRMESGAMSDKGLNEFQAEIAVLTKVRHRHLVALLGYCLEGNERLLVYEYMPQGTLSSHLFNWVKENLKPLEWSRRLTIALDVARGVEYLHSLAHQSFVHRDLKPSNILLGDDMRAKVADFGLVRLAPDGKMSFATKLAGTFGYLAPEYAATGRVTTKVDVFSFGVILMELITGRKALDDSQPEESCHLVTWFRRMNIAQDGFQKAIDSVIDLTEEILSSIRTVAELAGHCTAREPYQRPDMSHAVNVLSSLAEMWKPTEQGAEDIYGIDLDMTLPQALKKWQQFEGNSNAEFSSSSFFGGNSSAENTQTSIPTRPYGFGDSFTSTDGR